MKKSPLFLDGWLEFNRVKWNVQPLRVRYTAGSSDLPAVEAVFYLNKAGRIIEPRLNPYLPVAFEPTPVQGAYKLYRQWLAVAEPLVREMRKRGLHNTILFPPEVVDMRPWQWAGFRVGVKYTFHNGFPFDIQLIDPPVRRKIKQAQRANYICQRTINMTDVLDCLRQTEERQRFKLGLDKKDLECIRKFLGDEYFRAYVCYAPNGDPASARLILHCPGGRAVDWVVGTKTEHLQSGATQFLIGYVLEDLQTAGASSFDFEGANIRNVAAAKMNWGGKLAVWHSIETYTVRSIARWTRDWLHYMSKDGK